MTDLTLDSWLLEDDLCSALPDLVAKLTAVLTGFGKDAIKSSHGPHIVLLVLFKLFGFSSEDSFDHRDPLGKLGKHTPTSSSFSAWMST